MTSCARDRDGLLRVSDEARLDDETGLWMKEKRLSESGVCGAQPEVSVSRTTAGSSRRGRTHYRRQRLPDELRTLLAVQVSDDVRREGDLLGVRWRKNHDR